jgi:hypothetical protein
VDAQEVELLGDAQLVVHRCRDALDLQAVAQRGVEDLDIELWHIGFWNVESVSAHEMSPEK